MKRLYKFFTDEEDKPNILECIIVGLTVLTYIIYLVYVLVTKNSRVLSLMTLIFTAGAVAILAIREFTNHRRWWIFLQCAILAGILIFLFTHRWKNTTY